MKTINQIQADMNAIVRRLTTLSNDIDELKGRMGEEQAAPANDLADIERQARAAPVCNKGLKAAGEPKRQEYMRFLAVLAGGIADKLLFARRIGAGSGSKWDAERLAAERMHIKPGFISGVAERLKDLRYSLLLDSLVLAHISGNAAEADLQLIAGAADLLQCEDEDVAIVAQLAAAVIALDKKRFGAIKCNKSFPGLSHLIPQAWLEQVHVGQYSKDKHEQIVENGYVKKNQKLFRGSSRYSSKYGAITLIREINERFEYTVAPVAGIVTYIPKTQAASTKVFDVYICNPFDDNL